MNQFLVTLLVGKTMDWRGKRQGKPLVINRLRMRRFLIDCPAFEIGIGDYSFAAAVNIVSKLRVWPF
jgi:hypothetical protein